MRSFDTCHHLLTDTIHRILIEARFVDGQRKKIGHGVAIFREHTNSTRNGIRRCGKAHFRSQIIHAFLKSVRFQIARALIEKTCHQIGQPLLAGRVLRCAPLKEKRMETSGTEPSSTSQA